MNQQPANPDGAPLLEVKDLRAYFHTQGGTARAVDGVTFSIRRGETFALVGESGSGKSVTSLAILQLLQQPAGYIAGGQILLGGIDLTKLPPARIRQIRGKRISMIFQEPMTALNPVFTIGNQIREVLLLHERLTPREARERAVAMLDRVGIPDARRRYNEYPHQMSGGMRQRVMIAMALACRPELLITDEPTTALDVTIQSQILKLIGDLQQELGMAVLLVTHDMGVVRENAHRVGVMYAGRIVEESTQEQLFTAPAHPYTELLMRALPSRSVRSQRLASIEGMVPRATEFPEGCRFANRCPFVMPRCREVAPPDFAVGPGHRAACFLIEDPEQAGRVAAHARRIEPAPASALDRNETRLVTQDLKMHFPIRKGLLRRTVGRVLAVDGVSLVIHRGETVALVGESGCGKTTVGRCLVRLATPTAGSIKLHGIELTGLGPRALKQYRSRIQIIFQDALSSLDPRMMIGDSLREGMQTHAIGRDTAGRDAIIARVMEQVGLHPGLITRYPHELSGGQRQRVLIARALLVNPELIVCDEATSSLDVSVRAQILNLLKDLQSRLALSYLFITHDLSVVKYLADRVAVMYLGRIVERGTTEEIFGNPSHPYTRALLSAVPQVSPETGVTKIVLKGDVPSPINPPQGCHFHPRCPEARPECALAYPAAVELSQTHQCHCILAQKQP